MDDYTLNRVLNAALATMVGVLGLASVAGAIALVLTMFCSTPQGYYLEAADAGYTSSVYQDIKFGYDRLIFKGPNGQAWQVLNMVTTPEPEPESPYTTL